MRCAKVRKLSFMFYEDRLSKEEAEKIKDHLRDCPWCASEYKKVKKMMNAIETESPKVVPEELHKNIMIEVNGMRSFNETEKRENKIAVINALRRGAVALAAVFIVAFGLSFIDFNKVDLSNMGEVLKLNERVNDAIETAKKENTKSKSLTADDLILSVKKSDNKVESNVNESAIETEEELSVMNDNIDFASMDEEAVKEDKIILDTGAVTYTSNQDIISEKGFANVSDYADILETDDSITKKGLMQMYTPTFDKSLNELDELCDKYNANIYYKNIYLEDGVKVKTKDDYRTAVIALRVLGENYNKLKNEIEKLGTYDINVLQDEIKVETEEDVRVLLSNVKEQLLTHETKLDELDEDSDTYETDKEELKTNIASEEEAIKTLEAKLEAMSENIEVVKLEITFKEISEADLEGILSAKSFTQGISKGFINGWNKFIRFLQNIFLWITENLLFIITFVILAVILFYILKAFLLKDRE